MKLRAPSGCASICHDGQIFVVEADGSLEVKKKMLAVLTPHGFTQWDEEESIPEASEPHGIAASAALDIDGLTRAELFTALRAHGLYGSRRDTNATLRAKLREMLQVQRDTAGT